ncbi:MAG: alpha/beta hydrolase [Ardenticatenaceae bacterium]
MSIDEGVVQREFEVDVADETVPSVLWTPAPPIPPRALIAMGHGGSQHKKCESIHRRAIRYAKIFSWATLAIDAPKHGERISPEEAALERAKTLARVRGEPNAPAMSIEDKINYLDTLASQAVPEWKAALDAVLDGNTISDHTPIAYWGVSQGSSIGIPLLAADKRFRCAVLGLAHLHPDHANLRWAAQQTTIPLRFAFQWDDPIRTRAYGLALFDAFGSQEKSMHIHPGGHLDIPASEQASWDRFFERHLQ